MKPATTKHAPRLSTGGGRRRRMFTPGQLDALVLHLLQSGPRHGYNLMAEIEHRSGSSYAPSPGVLYPALRKLEDQGAIITVSPPHLRQRVYALTSEGSERARRLSTVAATVVEKLRLACPVAPVKPGAQVGAALKRLEAAILERRDQLPPGLEAQLAAKIDDLALSLRRQVPATEEDQS